MNKNKSYFLFVLFFVALSLACLVHDADAVTCVAGSCTISAPVFKMVANWCLTNSVISQTCDGTNSCTSGVNCCPDPGDVIMVSTTITNTGATTMNPGSVLFRAERMNVDTPSVLVDLWFAGGTYMNTHSWGGTNWNASYDEIVNYPEIPAGSSFTVSANYSLLRQSLSVVLALGSAGNLTMRVEVFDAGFNTYLGTTTSPLMVANRSKVQGCGGNNVIQDAATVLLVSNSPTYTTADTIFIEWSVLAAGSQPAGINMPDWGDASEAIVDIIKLPGAPSPGVNGPEDDCAAACGAGNCGTDLCTGLVKTITSNALANGSSAGQTPGPTICPSYIGTSSLEGPDYGSFIYAYQTYNGNLCNGNWTLNKVPDANSAPTSFCNTTTHKCYAVDPNTSITYNYTNYDTGGVLPIDTTNGVTYLQGHPFTNVVSFPASALAGAGNGYYLVRLRDICVNNTGGAHGQCGTPSHTIRGPQWTYFRLGNVPTFVRISDFRAYNDNGRAVIEWETSIENNTVGFYLFRLNDSGTYEQVNKKLIPAFMGSSGGGVYRLADEGAYPGRTYTYKLVEVERKGAKSEYGPYTVEVSGTGVSLNSRFSREPHIITGAKLARIANARRTNDAGKSLRKTKKGDPLKISIIEDGLYFLSASDIASILGLSQPITAGKIKNSLFILSNMGQQIAYLAAKDGSGIYFYGKAIDSIYTRENIYWLSQGKGLLMVEANARPGGFAPGDQTFSDTLHFEQDMSPWQTMFSDPDADYWFWDYAFGGIDGMDTKTFTITANDPSSSAASATLSVNSMAVATSSDTSAEHHVVVKLNGSVIGEDIWTGSASHTSTINFSRTLLNAGDNTIEVHALPDPAVGYSVILVDSFDLAYKRFYKAVNNGLRCKGDGNSVISVEGFTESEISVFDITDPGKPKYISGVLIEGTNGNYRVSFKPVAPQTVYFAVSFTGISSSFDKWGRLTSTLTGKSNRADYLIITTAGLKDTAQNLASYRRSKGLETMAVDIESIMDAFNYGISSPKAIKSFLSYAYKNWVKAPRYVVLVGNGTYDYKDNFAFGDNLVPPILVSTPDGLFASDNDLADVDGDSVPDMAIGRLPVVNAEELQAVTNKIIAYENASGGSWTKNIIMAAGNADPDAGDFPADSDGIASLVPSGYSVDKIYLSDYPMSTARQMLLDQINGGSYLLNYIGHGSIDRLDLGGLLLSSDIGSMTNSSAMPVVTAMTCFMNNFSYPGLDTLGETLLLKDGRGAAAVWGPTGLSLNPEAVILDKKFFKAVFVDGEKIFGDAVLKALKGYSKEGGKPFMLNIYNVIGDPALRMK